MAAAAMCSAGKNSSETSGRLRARADRIRKHARSLADDPAAERLEQLAQELDAKAGQIERQGETDPEPG